MTASNHHSSEAHAPQSGEIRGLIKIDGDKCKGCDACKHFCPTKAIKGASGAVHSIDADKCLSCGQCMTNCPFNAIHQTSNAIETVIKKLADKDVTVVGMPAPAVRVAIGEEFGMPAGSLVTGKMYGAMQKAGFRVFDVNYAADLTILEEGSEFIHRLEYALKGKEDPHGGKLPQFTSCCPAWVRYAEQETPSILPNLSTAKSPMQMAGAVAKTYGADVYKTSPEKIFTVGIMPCTAKKIEASRPEMNSAWHYHHEKGAKSEEYMDTDVVLTTVELAQLFKLLDIDLPSVRPANGDSLFAEYSGAGTIFGNTGGVMEAALRTAYKVVTGDDMPTLKYEPVRGLKGVKAAEIPLKHKELDKEVTLKVAVVHDIANNIEGVVHQVMAGTSPFHFIEVMNCPGGCVNGAGQPMRADGSSWLVKA